MRVLVDTNIFLRAIQVRHSARPLTRKAVRSLYEQGHELCIAPRNVAEFGMFAHDLKMSMDWD